MVKNEEQQQRSGLSGTLRMLAMIAVALLGCLGILFVLDVIPKAMLQDVLSKGLGVCLIIALVSVVISMLAKSK